ncbi:hypothetical protein B8W66_04100 [Mycobacterium decipiens]|uniref:Uncharacterized protein n=1 Tax=Mycobacterium decipiens TaxID=1430326 RepID=A0A1X2LZS2_9MYCO|nr:hypothetical protein B8W66_04100 [Mycobacterium decipiens]
MGTRATNHRHRRYRPGHPTRNPLLGSLFVYFRNSAHICLCTFAMRRWGQVTDVITRAIRSR